MANEFKHKTVGSELTQTEFEAVGGHVLDSQATGDIIYASSATQLTRLPRGSANQHQQMGGSNIPEWSSSATFTTLTTTGLITANGGITFAAGDDIAFTGSTGTNDITLTDSLADALSITRGGTDMVVFNSSTPSITFTPVTTFTGAITASGGVVGNADTATLATNVTVSANNSTDETIYPTFVDGATGTQGLETDTGLTYNPSTGALTSTSFVGALTGTASTATVATSVTASANNSTDETVYPAFVDGATGTQGIETDTGLTYNPSTGVLTSTSFTGNVTGNVTGNTSGTAATVTTAAQSNITSLGTLTALTVSGLITANGGITFADGDDITFTGASGTNDIVLVNGLADALSITDGSADILTVSTAGGTNTVAITGDLNVSGTLSADTATVASTVTITDNENTDESNAVIFTSGGDLDGGNIGLESDGDLHYNPSTGTLTATTFAGALTGTASTATVATTVTITDNESTNEDNAIIFTAGGDVDGGNIGLESDGTLTYNPSTGKVTATGFIGTLTGNVTGNTSGTAATVTGGTQASITTVANVTEVGALDAGSISSNFGNINIGASTFDTTGAVSTGNLSPAGDVAVADAKVVKLGGTRPADDEPASNNTGYGVVVLFDAGAAVAIGDAVSIGTDGRVIKTVADATGTLSGPCIGVATTAAGSADDDFYVMTHGVFRHDDWNFGTKGQAVYIEEADPGDLSLTAPNDDGDYAQRVGVAITDDVLLVMPSIDVIEHA